MNEQFVPYEIAIKLEEKGFNDVCLGFYRNDTQKLLVNNTFADRAYYEGRVPLIQAPLWQQVIDWLRDNHNIDIFIEPGGKPKMYAVFVDGDWIYENTKNRMLYSYKEARQAAIEHALTLI